MKDALNRFFSDEGDEEGTIVVKIGLEIGKKAIKRP